MASNYYTLMEGDEVYGSDGEKLGKVVAADANYVVIEKGWFFPTDYYIPTSAITSYADGKATLNVTKDVALNQGWDVAPTSYSTDTVTTETVVTDTPVGGYSTDEDVTTTSTYATDTANLATGYADTTTTRTTEMTDDTLTVPVYEEELVATKRREEVGGARIEKTVESVQETIEVPVTEERLKVVRRVVDRDVSAADAGQIFEDVIVDVPIEVEDVDVETRARIAEEVEIQREDVQRTEQVTGTVRREHVEVTEAVPGAVEGTGRTVRTTASTDDIIDPNNR